MKRPVRRFGSLIGRIALAAGWSATGTLAHEHWVLPEHFRPSPPAQVNVSLCSGHRFPDSETALADRVVRELRLILPDGSVVPLETRTVGRRREGLTDVSTHGVHLLHLALQRPRRQETVYEARAILVAGSGPDDPARYRVGTGLEIVPTAPVTGLVPGAELPLRLLMDGEPVSATLEAVGEQRRPRYLRTEPDAPGRLGIHAAGRYLVTGRFRGRAATLVFDVPAAAENAP